MNGISKEAEISIAASSMFPGFRFSPTDEELILYYLKKKLDGFDKCVEVIPEVDICKHEPWDLPAKAIIKSDQEWFFFSPRGKKYPNGSQSKRATEIGYWKATGKERGVKSGSNIIGTKRTLVFHIGRAPKGERTEWIMHEYCMTGKGQDALVVCGLRRKCDYHAADAPDGEVHFPRPLSMINTSGTYSSSGLDLIGTSGGDKMADGSQKKCTSSHDSHSVEQMDSAAESDRKIKDEIIQPDFSCHRGNDEDDLFADILNDNIVQLDETPPTLTPAPVTVQHTVTSSATVSIVPRVYSQQGQHMTPRVYPSQGTANRRIRLRKLRRSSGQKDELEKHYGENVPSPSSEGSSSERSPLRIRKVCSNSLYVVVIVMTLAFFVLTSEVSISRSVT